MRRLRQWRKLLAEGDFAKMFELCNYYSTCAVGEKLGLGPDCYREGQYPDLNWEARNAQEETGLKDIGQQFYYAVKAKDTAEALKVLREIEKS